eukprot:5157222-Pyramimonas_sp.AAC.1
MSNTSHDEPTRSPASRHALATIPDLGTTRPVIDLPRRFPRTRHRPRRSVSSLSNTDTSHLLQARSYPPCVLMGQHGPSGLDKGVVTVVRFGSRQTAALAWSSTRRL